MTDHLVDTNILIALLQPFSVQFRHADRAVSTLQARGTALWLGTQILTEFYNTLTRPVSRNPDGSLRSNSGLGYSAADALREVAKIERLYNLLPDDPAVYPLWKTLIATTGITGRQCFDVRLAALMQAYGLTHILTFNTRDFAALPGITPVDPATL